MKKAIFAIVLAAMSSAAMAADLPNWDNDPSVKVEKVDGLRLTCGDAALTVVNSSGQEIAMLDNGEIYAAVSQIQFSSSKVTAFAPLNKAGGAITGKAGFMISENVEADGLFSLLSGNIQTACNVQTITLDK